MKKMIQTFTLLLLVVILVTPSFASLVSVGTYSFELSQSSTPVSGKYSGSYRSYTVGDVAKISGTQKYFYISGSTTKAANIYSLLRQIDYWPDDLVGRITKDGNVGSFYYNSFGTITKTSSKYYLEIAKSAADNYIHTGNGTLYADR